MERRERLAGNVDQAGALCSHFFSPGGKAAKDFPALRPFDATAATKAPKDGTRYPCCHRDGDHRSNVTAGMREGAG